MTLRRFGVVVLVVLTGCSAVSTGTTATPMPASTGAGSSARPAARSSSPAADPPPLELVAHRVGLRMAVVPVGVSPDGQMALPPDPRQLGWYRFGPSPAASSGSAVLAGHVDSNVYGAGPLVRLRRVRPGDDIVIRLAGGREVRYRTTTVKSIAKKSLPELGVFDRDGRRLLRVITCGGAYDRARGGYQDNVVLTAEPT